METKISVMKKAFFITLIALFGISMLVNAQTQVYPKERIVTKFLGIPVDGTKNDMIQKLKNKGFKYDSTYDVLEGEFNGMDVSILIATNNNKVYRICVIDNHKCDEGQIKIRFNTLCQQFENNSKYISISDFTLSDKEDISYEMSVHHKVYQASYYQFYSETDTDEEIENRLVWFTIYEQYGQYQIVIYYDNGYNQANGDDL